MGGPARPAFEAVYSWSQWGRACSPEALALLLRLWGRCEQRRWWCSKPCSAVRTAVCSAPASRLWLKPGVRTAQLRLGAAKQGVRLYFFRS